MSILKILSVPTMLSWLLQSGTMLSAVSLGGRRGGGGGSIAAAISIGGRVSTRRAPRTATSTARRGSSTGTGRRNPLPHHTLSSIVTVPKRFSSTGTTILFSSTDEQQDAATTGGAAASAPRSTGSASRIMTNRSHQNEDERVDDDAVTDSSAKATATGSTTKNPSESRYGKLLRQVGLDHIISPDTDLSPSRTVSTMDVFCNRELKIAGIAAVGFDMDYTLAQYQQPNFDRLAFDGAKQKLVKNLGYPDAVLTFEYDHTVWARGLIIDTARGNFLKIDRHKYVRMAYHGMERMDSQTRKLLYAKSFNKVMSFTEKQFVNVDTLFQFVDAHLYALLIRLKDSGDYDALNGKTYQEIYRQVRESVDLCHRDGVIKDEVHRHPERYIVLDPGLVPMLRRFRKMGIKVFLVTNSLWEYTSTAMNYLYHGRRVPDEQQRTNAWLELFDLVVVGSCKPAFMLDPYLNLFRVDPVDGSLRNTDGVYEIHASSAREFLARGKTFQGGNWLHLQAMLETSSGDDILYVGDHLYSDVLRSKRTLGWRSAFIMPELPDEMRIFYEQRHVAAQISALRHLRDELGCRCDELLLHGETELSDPIQDLQYKDRLVKQKLKKLTTQWHDAFHSRWGALFNAGYQDSRFAFYVSNYACLYTAVASNLGLASSLRSFRTPAMERLPHDRLLEDPDTQLVDTTDAWDAYTLGDVPAS